MPVKYPLDGATILITGGAGLVGSHLVDYLIDQKAGEIRVLDNLVRGRLENLADAQKRKSIVLFQSDIRDRDAVASAVQGCDYVFHQAALRITLCAERPRAAIDVLVNGTFNIFEAAVAARVRKVVYASSASVYGAADTFPIPESHHPYNNRTLYGACKVMNEGIARSFREQYGLPSVGLRYFNIYGPRMDVTGVYTEVLIRWLDSIDQNLPPQIHGDGSATMDFVYVADVARANILALTSDREDDVYNIAQGRETSLLQLWQALQEATGTHHLHPEFHPPRRVNPVPRRLADIRLAQKELGFTAQTSLSEGLKKLIQWRRMQQREIEVA